MESKTTHAAPTQESRTPIGAGSPEEGKCGLGPRIPLLVISPYARRDSVSNTLIDQSSVVRFVEHNWGLPTLGNGAADQAAGSLASLFDLSRPANPPLYLNPNSGEPLPGPLGPPGHTFVGCTGRTQ